MATEMAEMSRVALAEEVLRLRAEADRWRPYIDHKRDCPQLGEYDRDCPCGYVETLRDAITSALGVGRG